MATGATCKESCDSLGMLSGELHGAVGSTMDPRPLNPHSEVLQ